MKAGWEEINVGDVVKLNYGKALAKNERNPNGSIPVYGANGILDWSDRHLTEGPSLVVGRKGSVGEVTRVNGPFWPSDVTYFTSHDRSRLDFNFLHYVLKMLNLPSMARGVKPGINRNDVYGLTIPLPPLEEQQRIVAILDEAFEGLDRARENVEANLESARELFDSLLAETLTNETDGWECHRLRDCFRLKSGDGLTSKEMTVGTYPVYGGNGVAGTHDQYNLSGDNVIVGRVGALCGNARYINQDIWLTDNAFKVVDYKHEFDHLFLTYLLNLKNLRSLARQTAQPVISNSSLADLELAFPKSVEMQNELASKFAAAELKIESLTVQYKTKMSDLDDLRQSLLQKASAGELT